MAEDCCSTNGNIMILACSGGSNVGQLANQAAIVFIDVWKNKEPAKRFGIRAIPTQIFFDKEGKGVYRHEGFMGEADIDQVFGIMGVS